MLFTEAMLKMESLPKRERGDEEPATSEAERAMVDVARAKQAWAVAKETARAAGLPETAIPAVQGETTVALKEATKQLFLVIASFESSGL